MLVDVDIVNMALRHIGHQPIVSLSDRSPQAVNGRLAWATAFADFLASHDWTFARRSAGLVPVSPVDQAAAGGFTNRHYLPKGFERLVKIDGIGPDEQFSLVLDGDVKVLATNRTEVGIQYIANDFSLSVMPAPAVMALMARLAFHLDLMLNAGVGSRALIPFMNEMRDAAVRYEGTARNRHTINPGELNEVRNG